MPTVEELESTRNLTVGDGKVNLRKSYVFTGYADERSCVDVFGTTVGSTNVPFIRCRHSQVDSNGWPQLFCFQYDLSRIVGSTSSWRVDFDFRSIQPAPATTNSNSIAQGPDEVGFDEMTGKVSASFENMYRANILPVENPADGADCGGTPVDVLGQPTSVLRKKYEIQMNKTSYQPFERDMGLFGAEVGTRTGAGIFGLPSGSCLYMGATITRIDHNAYRISHTWLYDQFFHTIQVPKYDPSGLLELDDKGCAKTVYLVQPFNTGRSADFAR
jgi:hypothetical protein